jgi:GPI mannosyltransferase 2
MLWLTIQSAVDVIYKPEMVFTGHKPRSKLLVALALPQLVLGILALTSYHVQIITRLASGYPIWYMWLAKRLQTDSKVTTWTIRWMILYGLIQAGLYASFLPPA